MPFEPAGPKTGFTPASPEETASPSGGFTPAQPHELTQLKMEAPPGYERTETGLQPAGLVDPGQFTPTMMEEDARRLREGAAALPGQLARGAMNTAERLTDLPITRMYARTVMDANKVSATGVDLPTMDSAVHAITPAGQRPTKKATSVLDYLAAFDTEGANPAASDPNQGADVTFAGTSITPADVANAAAHNVVGRPVKAFQRGPGTALSQMAMEAAKPAIQDQVPPQGGGAMGGSGADQPPEQQPLTQPFGGKEARELLAREMLSFYAGGDFQFGFDDKRYASAVDQLQREFGAKGGAAVQSLAHEIGGLPVYLWTSGAGEMAAAPKLEAAQAAVRSLPKMTAVTARTPAVKQLVKAAITEGTVEGATQGMLQSAARGEDIFTGAGYGAFLGGVIGWAAGAATAKKQVMSMSKDWHTGLMLSRQATNDFLKELDQAIVQTQTKRGSKPTFEELVGQGSRGEDFDIRVVDGEPVKPLGSYRTVNERGEPVLRDVEVVSVKKKYQQASRPTENVEVSTKPVIGQKTPKGRFANPKSTSVGDRLEVIIKKRDTVIKDREAMVRLETQQGRRMLPALNDDLVDPSLGALQKTSREATGEGGTLRYMAPDQAERFGKAKFGPQYNAVKERLAERYGNNVDQMGGAKEAWKEAGPTQANTKIQYPETGPASGVILSADADGALSATVIRQRIEPHPDTWQMKGGDTVLIDGQAPGTIIGDVDPSAASSRLTVELKNGQKVQVNPSQVTRTPREFNTAPDHGGAPIISAKPGSMVDDRTLAIVKGIEQGTTIPTMMKVAGRHDPVWAAAALRDMEAKGILYEAEPGLFVPTAMNRARPKVGPEKDPAGYAVFIGTGGPNNRGEIGILRGKDPRNAKNWLIERPNLQAGGVADPVAGQKFKRTTIESIPEDELRSMHPVGLASKAEVDPSIDMYGWNKPMPPQFYQMSKATQGDQELMTKAWSKVNTTPGFFQRSATALKEAFAGAMHTADPRIRHSAAQKLFTLAGMMRSEGLTRAQMLAKNLELGTAASRDLTKVLEATRSRSPSGKSMLNKQALDAWVNKYPAEAKAALDDFKKMTMESDSYSQFLASRGIANIDNIDLARRAGLEEEYLTRTYQAFLMPREKWADYARKNLTDAWNDTLRWLYENRPNHQNDFGTTAAEFDEILRLDNPIEALRQKGYIKAEGTKKLIERQDVPEPIRRLLGEHRDAAIKLAFTTAYQRQVVKQIEGWDAISDHPLLWSPGWRPDMTLKVPDSPQFGRARNGFVPDNATTRHLLGDKAATMAEPHGFLRAVGWVGRKWKAAHTVYNQVSWFNNVVRNMKGVILSGGFTGPEDYQGFRDAARMLMDYSRDPTIYGPNKLLVEAMDFDAVGPGLAGAELGLEQRNFTAKMLRVFEKQRRGPTPLLDAFAEAREAAMSVPEKIHNGYDFADKLAKFGSYLNIRRRFIAQGMSPSDAAARSSYLVNSSFQNFLQTPAGPRAFSTNLAVAAPFLTSKMEDLRINATAVKRVLSGQEPDLIFRLMAMGAMFGGATYLANAARRTNGISDQQDEMEKQSLPMRVKERHPFLIGSLDYDERGRRTYTDLTPYEDLLMAFRGNVNDPVLARIIFNNALDIVGEQSLTGDVVNGIGQWSGAITPDWQARPPRPDQSSPIGLAQRVGQQFIPQGLMNVVRASDRMSPSGKLINPEGFTIDQALQHGLTGTVDAMTGPATNQQSAMERAGYVMDAEKNIKAAAKEGALQGVSPDRLKYMTGSNVRKLKQDLTKSRPINQGKKP